MKRASVLFLAAVFLLPSVAGAATIAQDWNTLLGIFPEFQKNKQAVCVSDEKGKILFSQNENLPVVPASVSKVYTTDFVLSQMDKNYRFKTDVVLVGDTLYINGDADPFFIDAHLNMLMLQVSRDYPRVYIRKVVFNNFYMNWSTLSYATILGLKKNLVQYDIVANNVLVYGSYARYNGPGVTYRFTSRPLVVLIKQMNIYSTNSASELLFARVGGVPVFQKYMKDTYGAGTDTISFSTGSGLEGNTTTCALTLTVMKHLAETLKKQGITFKDILPTPVVDGGSMRNRMSNIKDKTVLLVKPGFVYNHETLTGVMRTLDGNIYFAIFTDYPDVRQVSTPRYIIDTFAQKLIERYHALPFAYLDVPVKVEREKVERVR